MNKGLLGKVSFVSLFVLTAVVFLILLLPGFSDAGLTNVINVTLGQPTTSLTRNVNFTYNVTWNSSENMVNCTLYGNFTGGTWAASQPNQSELVNDSINWINNTVGADGKYIWNVYCYDDGSLFDYDSPNKTVTVDTESPHWSNNATSALATYSPSTPYVFNITWIDTGSGLSPASVQIEGNWSNPSGANYTMSNIEGNVYSYNATLPAGTFYWKSYASDMSLPHENVSGTWYFTISKAGNPVNLYLNDTLNSNKTYTYPQTINATATSAVGTVYLYRNNISIINGASPQLEQVLLGNGTYAYFVNSTSGNANYSDNTSNTVYYAFVVKGTPTVTLYLNNSQDSQTSVYPNSTINATATSSVSGLYVQLWRNGTLIDNVTSTAWNVTQWAAYPNNFSAQVLGNANYTDSAATTIWWNVSKGTLSLSLSVPNVTYPSNAVATVTETNTGDADVNYTLYRDNTGLVNFSTALGAAPAGETVLLGVGNYIYTLNTTSGTFTNYTANTTGITAALNVSKGTPTLSLALNSVEADKSVTYPTAVTATGSFIGDTGANISLYRNNSLANSSTSLVSITYTDTPTAAIYNYTLIYNGTQNYTTSSVTRILTVSTAPSSTTGGSSIGGLTTTGMISYITLGVGKTNITANFITTTGKLIANIARYQDVAIRGMNITVVNNVANIKIMTFKLATLPSSVPYDINGKVYNYISVDKANFTDADIKTVNINFAVNKTWLTNNNVDASNITLYRWASNKWNDLNAVKVSDDGKEVFFTVSSPGLSVFIIGTKGGAPAVTETPTTCTESWTCTGWSTCANSKQTRTCTDANNCGTTASKPSESQSCTVSKGETAVEAPVATSILTTVIIIVIAIIACVFIFLQRAKISSYLVTITKKSNNRKKASYLESLARKISKVEEEEEEKLNVRTD